jgi:hypothetical protein
MAKPYAWPPVLRLGNSPCFHTPIAYDLFHANTTYDDPTKDAQILEQALECENMYKAVAWVEHNGGSAGVDGMTVSA